MAKFIEITIEGVTIPKLVVAEKCEVKFSDLKLSENQCMNLTKLVKAGCQVDLVIRQREKPLFESE